MRSYRVRLFVPEGEDEDDSTHLWGWEVLLWLPENYLLGCGAEPTREEAIATALSLVNQADLPQPLFALRQH